MINFVWNSNSPSLLRETQLDWNQTLVTKINEASADRIKTSLHGGA